MLTTGQAAALIAVMALVTLLTRALPFLLFDRGEHPPKVILYLGRVLPAATMGLLVVYCLKGVSWTSAPHGLPELLAIAAVTVLHKWKNNVLLSIAGGTVLYMLLVQLVFV